MMGFEAELGRVDHFVHLLGDLTWKRYLVDPDLLLSQGGFVASHTVTKSKENLAATDHGCQDYQKQEFITHHDRYNI
jgi:hypothetical protein